MKNTEKFNQMAHPFFWHQTLGVATQDQKNKTHTKILIILF